MKAAASAESVDGPQEKKSEISGWRPSSNRSCTASARAYRRLRRGPRMSKWRTLDQAAQARPELPEPALLLAVVGTTRLEQVPEALRVVHYVEVRDLVLDDVREHGLGCEQQPPGEAHRAG